MSASRPPFPRRARTTSAIAAALLSLAAATASRAQTLGDLEAKVVQTYASYGWTYDDNVLGLPNAAYARAVTGSDATADVARTGQAGLTFDKQLSQQRLTASLSGSDTRYSRFTALDNQGREVRGNWNWHIGQHLEGNLGASSVRSLGNYTDFHSLEKNLITTGVAKFDARWQFHPSWSVGAIAARTRVLHDALSLLADDRTEFMNELRLDYRLSSGTSLGVFARRTRGAYDQPLILGALAIDKDFTQSEVQGHLDWRVSQFAQVQLTAGGVSRTHETYAARDFHGSSARLDWNWEATAKTAVSAAVWRQPVIVDDLVNAYAVANGISVTPIWNATAKLQVQLQGSMEQRNYQPSNAFLATTGTRDTLKNAAFSLKYVPMRHWLLAGTLYRSSKDADMALNSFARRGATLTAQYQY